MVLAEVLRVVAALPEDMRPEPNPFGFPWALVICAAIGFFAVLLWRSFQSVRSRLYMGREKKLALKLYRLIEEKCELVEKVSLVQKEYEGLESSLKDASFEKKSTEAPNWEAKCEKLDRSLSKLGDKMLFLEKEFKEESSKHCEQDKWMADISRRTKSLEDESKSLKSQIAEAKTTLRIFQMNQEGLKLTIKEALNENSQLQETQKQHVQETEVWPEQVSDLNKQKMAFEDSKVHVEQVLSDEENHIQSLTECLPQIKDGAPVLREDLTDDGNLELEMKSESETGAHLENQPKGALKKLVYAAEFSASLETLDGGINQIYTLLSEVDKAKKDLIKYVNDLQTEQASLQSENSQFKLEHQKLQEKLKVTIEQYQQNEMKLHRKLVIEESYRLQQEEKFSNVDKNTRHAAEKLETYRKRAKDLDEELERTTHSYQRQIISFEKKAHHNELASRISARNLNYLKKENAHLRQKLTESELKLELLEKDQYALGVSNTAFGRHHPPCCPSPLDQPSSEMRPFHVENRSPFIPVVPVEGGRGSRGPENPLDPQISNERRELSCDRSTDPQTAPSDTGPLPSPWEQDRRMLIPPSGQPYSGPRLPPQRQDAYYSNYGRLSGPAEVRSLNMPSLDKVDGPMSLEMEPSRKDSRDDLGNSNVPDSPLPASNQATGSGFVLAPFSPTRVPLLPVDPRSQFMRRGPFFPPPPPGNLCGASGDYFPCGPPRPPFPMQNICSRRCFPHYLPPRAGFSPPTPAF